ncbi:hypothetical protein TNCV_3115971 [Trichonephila clavipes]|nr:hypothetical protein TNCV_3115971 [Trichonephila clavipes]
MLIKERELFPQELLDNLVLSMNKHRSYGISYKPLLRTSNRSGKDASQGPGRSRVPWQVSGGQDRRTQEATAGAEQEKSDRTGTGPFAS